MRKGRLSYQRSMHWFSIADLSPILGYQAPQQPQQPPPPLLLLLLAEEVEVARGGEVGEEARTVCWRAEGGRRWGGVASQTQPPCSY
jgi:hypothetical protein